jgi:hypothetical protein
MRGTAWRRLTNLRQAEIINYRLRRVNQTTPPARNQTTKLTQKMVAARGSSSVPLAKAFWKMKTRTMAQVSQSSHSINGRFLILIEILSDIV